MPHQLFSEGGHKLYPLNLLGVLACAGLCFFVKVYEGKDGSNINMCFYMFFFFFI